MKSVVKMDSSVQTELNEKLQTVCKILLIVGLVLVVSYVALSVAFETDENAMWFNLLLWAGAVPTGFGLVFSVSVKKINKKSGEVNAGTVFEIELFEEYFCYNAEKNGERIAFAKVYYKDCVKMKQTANYLFFYLTASSAVPVGKSSLSDDETELVKGYYKSAKQQSKAQR